MDCDTIEERCKLYAAIERADTQLVDTHELKVALARQLVEQCLLIHRGMSWRTTLRFSFFFCIYATKTTKYQTNKKRENSFPTTTIFTVHTYHNYT